MSSKFKYPFMSRMAGVPDTLTTALAANLRTTVHTTDLDAYAKLADDETVTGNWTFNRGPVLAPQSFSASGSILASGGSMVWSTAVGGSTLTLPAAPASGTWFEIFNASANGELTLARGGADQILTVKSVAVTSIKIPPGGSVRVWYETASGVWLVYNRDFQPAMGLLRMTTNNVFAALTWTSFNRAGDTWVADVNIGGSTIADTTNKRLNLTRAGLWLVGFQPIIANAGVTTSVAGVLATVANTGTGYVPIQIEQDNLHSYSTIVSSTQVILVSGATQLYATMAWEPGAGNHTLQANTQMYAIYLGPNQ